MEYNLAKQKGDPFWKLITPRFPLSEDGKYRWKNDTSSDELAGHYLIYDLYYRHVAETEEEKEPIRQVVREMTDHLLRNDFNLIDHDGQPTRWGRFGPDYLYTAQGWEQRGLNSLMLLTYLAIAQEITGDAKYAETAEMLRDKYFYDINTVQPRPYFPPENVVPWDNGFVMLSFYALMNYDPDPERQIVYRRGLEDSYLFISRQTNPFWSFFYGATATEFEKRAESGHYDNAFPDFGPYAQYWLDRFAGWDQDAEGSVESLRELPLDLVAWFQKNSHRLDVQHDPTPTQKYEYGWSKVDGKALPYSERGHVRLDRDCFDIDLEEGGEGSGMSLHEGTIFLLPYYIARFYGFIE
jgi:hypothetical protein